MSFMPRNIGQSIRETIERAAAKVFATATAPEEPLAHPHDFPRAAWDALVGIANQMGLSLYDSTSNMSFGPVYEGRLSDDEALLVPFAVWVEDGAMLDKRLLIETLQAYGTEAVERIFAVSANTCVRRPGLFSSAATVTASAFRTRPTHGSSHHVRSQHIVPTTRGILFVSNNVP